MGKLDNTLVIYISGDNGTSAEGSTLGTPFDLAALEGIDVPVADQLKFYDVWGSPATTPHMAVAWSWAFDTPFKWTKQIASHFGGTRQGMVDRLAEPDQRRWRHSYPVPPPHRHRAHDPRRYRHPGTEDGERDRSEAHRRREHGLYLRQGERERPLHPHHAVFRDVGQSGHLPRWLDGFHDPACKPRGWWAWPRCPTWSTATNGSCITSPRTTRRPTISQPRCPTSCGRCRSSSSWKRRNTRCSPWTTASFRGFSPPSRATPLGEPSSPMRAN